MRRRATDRTRPRRPPRPPRLAERLLAACLPPGLSADGVLGDLAEELHRRGGSPAASFWYWRQALALAARFAWRRRRRGPARPAPFAPIDSGEPTMSNLWQDLRFAVRTLRKSPGFTAVAVLTLAVGIGANCALASVVESVLLRPSPYPEPARLAALWETVEQDGGKPWRVSPSSFLEWRDRAGSFAAMALYGSAGFNLTGAGEPTTLLGGRVSADYFQVLGISPALGRGFAPEDFTGDRGARVAVLGHGLWQRRFGGDPDVVGRTLTLDDEPYTVVGVMPPGLYPTWPTGDARVSFDPRTQQIWVPMPIDESARSRRRRNHVYGAVARLADGVTLEAARTELEGIAAAVAAEHPDSSGLGVRVGPFRDELVGSVRPALLVLLAAVGCVLLIACANVAHLQLARAGARRAEVAVRGALGAGRGRLVRQLLVESLLVAGTGAVLGAGLAAAGVRLLVGAVPLEVPGLAEARVDVLVLALAAALALVSGVAFGLYPALDVTRRALRSGLATGGRGAATGRGRLRGALLVVEVGLAVLLVIAAGLLIQSFRRLGAVAPGFEPRGVAGLALALPDSRYPDAEQVSAFWRRLAERVEALPGVTGVAYTYDHPLEANWITGYAVPGRPGPDGEEGRLARVRTVSPGYFRNLGIRLAAGRDFGGDDDLEHPGAAIVNRALVREVFGDRAPEAALGRPLETSTVAMYLGEGYPERFEIVGVVEDVKLMGLDRPAEPAFYLPLAQFPLPQMKLVARTAGDPAALLPALRGAVWEVDPDQPVGEAFTVEGLYAAGLAPARFNMLLMALFGGLALLLAVIGVYGVLSYAVSRRRHEIGLRMALGADRGDVVSLVVAQGMAPVALGLALGVAAAAATGRLLAGLLYGVEATDPVTYAAVVAALAAVALAACWLPARRAAVLDPVAALRRE